MSSRTLATPFVFSADRSLCSLEYRIPPPPVQLWLREPRGTARSQPTGSPRAVALIRVSTFKQAVQGVSLEAQDERVRAYCQMAGVELVPHVAADR